MKLLRKINKGLVLTVIVLGILCIYLFSVEAKRNSAKPEIEKAVKEYIELINKYAVVPEDLQKVYELTGDDEEIEKTAKEVGQKLQVHLDKYEEELKTKMIDNQTAVDMQKDMIKDFLESANTYPQAVVIKYDKEIKKIKKYVFDEDQVTVTFIAKSEIESKYLDERRRKNKKR